MNLIVFNNNILYVQKMLQLDPSKRISAISALSHPYFFEFHGVNSLTLPFEWKILPKFG